jgi:hypothetical protein
MQGEAGGGGIGVREKIGEPGLRGVALGPWKCSLEERERER